MNFTCSHCGAAQTATEKSMANPTICLSVGSYADIPPVQFAHLGATIFAVRCANNACLKVTVNARLHAVKLLDGGWKEIKNSTISARLPFPGSAGKPFPEHVPKPFLEDYQEAWGIVTISPKSSATLARRCLQAMIRDFCNIREKSLHAEIGALKKLADLDTLPKGVEAETIAAMDALREVGNIGAHMMENGGEILDVEQGEAEALLALIEMLFVDWYIARGKRLEKLQAITAIAASKKARPAEGNADGVSQS